MVKCNLAKINIKVRFLLLAKEKKGDITQRESVCFAFRKSSVRIRLSPKKV